MADYRYQEVFETLKSSILSGKVVEGELLPSENQLSQQYNLNRMTVRRALGELEKEGFIIRKKGKGSIVKQNQKRLGLLSFKGFSEVIGQRDGQVSNTVLEGPKVMDWPKGFFYPLDQKERKTRCIFLKRLRSLNEKPLMLEFTYLPVQGLSKPFSGSLSEGSLFKTLSQNYGIAILSLEQEIRAISADREIAEELDLEIGMPVLWFCRKYKTSKEGYFVYSTFYFNTQDYAISNGGE